MSNIKQSDKTIQLSGGQLKSLVENVPGIVYQFQINSDGKCSFPYVSPTIFKYLGLTVEEVMEDVERWLFLTHPDDLPGLEASVIESMETMSQWQWQGRFLKGGTEVCWFRGSANPEKLDDGSILWNGVFADITQQKKTEVALIASERMLNSVLTNTTAVVYVKNLDGTFVFINKKFEELFGITNEAAVGTSSYDIFPEEITDVHKRNDLAVIKARKPIESEESALVGDEMHTYLSVKFCLFDAEDEPYALCGISTDITERKKAEEILKRSKAELEMLVKERSDELIVKNAQYQALIENAADSIFFYDEKGRFFGSNKHAQEVLGYTEEEINKLTIFDINKVVIPEQVLLVLKSLVPGEIGKFEGAHQCRDGSSFPVDVRVASYMSNGVKNFIGIARDITVSKQVEQSLAESELRFRTLSTYAPVGIFMNNLEGECVYVNEKCQQLIGLSSEQAMGAGWANALHVDDRASVFAEWQRFMEQGGEFSLEYRFCCPDGSENWVSGKAISLLNPDGSLSGYLGTVTDITDSKNSERQIVAAREEAESANKSKSEFLARMSHELRTPLNAILGFAQLLKMNKKNFSDDQGSSIEHILSGGKHLLHLIDEILDLSKVDAGKIDIYPEDVSLRDVISSSERLVKSLAEKHEVSVNYSADILHYVHADKCKLEQVLVNLLSNAIKYNQKGGKVDIDIKSIDGDMIRISVSDTGCGIKPEYLKLLYEPFKRIDSSKRSVEGAGIGLTITKKLVELMDGSIGVESEFGKGSIFWIDMHAASPVFLSDETQSRSGGVSIPNFICDLKVLYVEDNPANMDLMQQIFRQTMGCDLLMATNAEDGIEIAKTNLLDLILMDIDLPGISGLEALRILKADEKTAHMPVIAVSAHAMPDQIESGKNEGFADYLPKPVQIEELVNIIQEIVA